MKLIRENVFGTAELDWNEFTQRELRLTEQQVEELNAGAVIHTPKSGGTRFYLVKADSAPQEQQVPCPMCGGSGHVDRSRIYGTVRRPA